MVTIKEKNFVSAVLYVHDCEETIGDFIKSLHKVLSGGFEKFEIICIDDASSDDSVSKIKQVGGGLDGACISIIHMSYYQGLELSMNAGIDLAIGDFVFEFDKAFIDYDEKLIMDVYNHSLKGFDIVSTSSNAKKSASSRLFYKVFNKNAHTQYPISTETFRVLSRRAINRVHGMSKTIPYRKALYANCGLKLDVITYAPISGAKYKKEKQYGKERQAVAADSLILFTNIAYKLSLGMTVLMMLSTVVTAVYAIVVFISQKPVAGWTTTTLFMSFSFFGIFAILAVVIKYLSILVDLIFKKQKYVIEGIEKLGK
ncbi:MAG: glycosyltransferase [Oscillospiraceae bacterium]